MAAATALRRRKAREPGPAELTHHSSLIAREEPLAGNANARKQKVERAATALANPGSRKTFAYGRDNRIASRLGSFPNQR